MERPLINTHQGIEVRIQLSEAAHIPGEMPLLLCDLIHIPKGAVVADVGCGNGYLGIVASLLGASVVYSIDPCAEAIALTKSNCEINEVSNLHTIIGQELLDVRDKKFDIIISNPPQTPFPTQLTPMRYGGRWGTDVIERIIQQAASVLKANGRIYLSHVSHAYPQRVYDCIRESGFKYKLIHTLKTPLSAEKITELHPGLLKYIVSLWKEGVAELEEIDGALYYYHRLYEISC